MDRVNYISRRSVVTWGLVSAGLSLLPTERVSARSAPLAQAGASENDELYEGKNLPGGGQIDPRLSVSPYANDEDIVEVAERMSPFNPESWHVEWKRVAEKNERLAEEFEKEGLKVAANGFYLRAARFYQDAVIYLPESDLRMLPAFNKLIDMYKRAWQLVPPPFDRVEIPYEGTTLPGYFAKPRGNPGQRFPTVYAVGGADSTLIGGGGGAYTARGMAYLFVDGPGQGIPLRLNQVYAPPDSERVAKAVFDYLVTRPDVDPDKLGIAGASMGGYTAPRCASGEKRCRATAFWSGAYSLREDIFDYFPPICDRLRWLMGAKDPAEAKTKIAEFTLEGKANQIECPLLIGYSKDDRIMDPRGAFRLYEAATRSKREMLEGVGHDSGRVLPASRTKAPREVLMADWMMKHLVAA
jgi:dienelactone hydrolase